MQCFLRFVMRLHFLASNDQRRIHCEKLFQANKNKQSERRKAERTVQWKFFSSEFIVFVRVHSTAFGILRDVYKHLRHTQNVDKRN